jgi:hypothetical protein
MPYPPLLLVFDHGYSLGELYFFETMSRENRTSHRGGLPWSWQSVKLLVKTLVSKEPVCIAQAVEKRTPRQHGFVGAVEGI